MSTQSTNDTIAAIATAPGEAGISIVRISGPASLGIADQVFRGHGEPPSQRAAGTFLHGFIRRAAEGSAASSADLDEVILLVYRAPHSYTREDVVEIQGHGGRACARRILQAVLASGARLAEPGEFTRRAFLSGRIDLLQAEAVMDLVHAQSERAAASAIEQLQGKLTYSIANIYNDLIRLGSEVEAALDFPEEDVKDVGFADAAGRVTSLLEQIQSILSGWEEGHVLREGALVAILGPPNVGKSTLLNRLLEKERAIVTDIPGTTRDSIEETCIVRGIPLRLVDTAGLRATDCTIEQMGVDRARAYVSRADIVLFVVDGSAPLDEETRAYMQSLNPHRSVLVLNKTDLGKALTAAVFPEWACVTTCLTRNEGLDDIRKALVDRLGFDTDCEPHAVISERHRQGLLRAVIRLDECRRLLGQQREDAFVLIASELRQACEEIGRITGRSYDIDLIDSIFSMFCIGK